MKTAIHNTLTNTTTIRQLPTIGGKPHPIPAHYVIVEVIDTPAPTYDSAIERLQSEYVLDLDNKTYTLTHEVIQLSEYEIAMRDWEHPDYEKRIVAPEILLMQFANVLTHFQAHGFPTKVTDTKVYLWCNTIRDEHIAMINQANDYLKSKGSIETVYEELRPKVEDYE